MTYHLFKKTRKYEGFPYQGPTNKDKPAVFETLAEAERAAHEFNRINPVGWDIYDATTGELVSGVVGCLCKR